MLYSHWLHRYHRRRHRHHHHAYLPISSRSPPGFLFDLRLNWPRFHSHFGAVEMCLEMPSQATESDGLDFRPIASALVFAFDILDRSSSFSHSPLHSTGTWHFSVVSKPSGPLRC